MLPQDDAMLVLEKSRLGTMTNTPTRLHTDMFLMALTFLCASINRLYTHAMHLAALALHTPDEVMPASC